jgi:NitT/TauT family transport system substrate-binding protein
MAFENETKMKRAIFILMMFSVVLAACQSKPAITSTAAMTPVRLPVGYVPNIQFAPLYVAIDKGFFKDAGIDVTLDYNMENDNVALVGAGQLQFAIVSGEQVLMGRGKGLPVVYVADWYQQYPVGVVSLADQNITKPGDLAGKKIALPGLYGANYIGLDALLYYAGLDESKVSLDSVGYTQVETLASKRDSIASIYVANEPIQLKAQGYAVNVLSVSDYVDLIGNGLITNEQTLKNDPDLVQRMVTVLIKSIQYTLDHPDEAYTISMKYVDGLKADDAVQRQVLAASIVEWKADRMGYSQPEGWNNMQNVLLKMGLLDKSLDLSQAFTNQFIPEQ